MVRAALTAGNIVGDGGIPTAVDSLQA
jgi:hypothetical protein